jgi:alkanesulfonate monooxygenase SsuD/methylene tetrahydromethanopterin reductase-like flavin-dependent oxidoreductase (luciferase family)
MPSSRGIFVAPFNELADPRLLAQLAADAEAGGWDGFFLWDHIVYGAPVRDVLDPWVALAAIATATERLRIGPLVTPIPRRRPQKLARETVTLDLLSGGRTVLGVGIGSDVYGELSPFGDPSDPRELGRLLDEGLAKLMTYWSGGFTPLPVQRPRIPVWAAARWPARKPVRRAARLDGLFPIELPDPAALATLAGEVATQRAEEGITDPYDLIVTNDHDYDPAPWEAAGATWTLRGFGKTPSLDEVRAVIAAGPNG